MEKILFINACVRKNSRTLELAECLMSTLSGERENVDLYDMDILPLDDKGLEIRDMANCKGDFSDNIFKLAKQFSKADTIVVAAPYWDMMFPAVLKTYLENITVCGLTFNYNSKGIPQGNCNAKAIYYITTAGGFIGENDFGFSYIKALAQNFFEIPKISRIAAEGLDIAGANVDEILAKAKNNIIKYGEIYYEI